MSDFKGTTSIASAIEEQNTVTLEIGASMDKSRTKVEDMIESVKLMEPQIRNNSETSSNIKDVNNKLVDLIK